MLPPMKRTLILLALGLSACGKEPEGPAWQYPPGDAKKTFEQIPLPELIARWKSLPKEKSQYGLHGTYAEAIGLHGEKAAQAVPDLEPYVTDEKRQNLRQAAMKGLAGIGAPGVPALVRALRHKAGEDDQVMLRWDAAMALATMGPSAVAAVPELEACLLDPKENVNTQESAVEALVKIGPPAKASLTRARDAFMGRGGLSPGQTSVLRGINQGLAGLR